MGKIKHIGTCIGLSGGISAFVLLTLAGYTQLIYFIWAGFLSMIIYFAAGGNKDWKLAGRMILSFCCGLLWGQLSNQIYVHIFPVNGLVATVLDYFVLVGLLLWVHLSLLEKTPFNHVPSVFLGLALTIGFFGRPFPFAGQGLCGEMPPVMIILYLLFYMVFGLVFSLMINYLTGFFAGKMFRQKK